MPNMIRGASSEDNSIRQLSQVELQISSPRCMPSRTASRDLINIYRGFNINSAFHSRTVTAHNIQRPLGVPMHYSTYMLGRGKSWSQPCPPLRLSLSVFPSVPNWIIIIMKIRISPGVHGVSLDCCDQIVVPIRTRTISNRLRMFYSLLSGRQFRIRMAATIVIRCCLRDVIPERWAV